MDFERMITFMGRVEDKTCNETLSKIKELHLKNDHPITLTVTSHGGSVPMSLAFYDIIRLMRPNLRTIASGCVDSSAVIIWLSANTRAITPHTQMTLHPGSRSFGRDEKSTQQALECSIVGLAAYEKHYLQILVDSSRGKLSRAHAKRLNQKHTVLLPDDLLKLGLAQEITE